MDKTPVMWIRKLIALVIIGIVIAAPVVFVIYCLGQFWIPVFTTKDGPPQNFFTWIGLIATGVVGLVLLVGAMIFISNYAKLVPRAYKFLLESAKL